MKQQTRAQDLGLNSIGNGNKGSYASRQHEEGSVSMPAKDWGYNNLHEGSKSPWGRVQTVTNYAPGIDRVDCAGHGGIKLSPKRNRAIPVRARNSNGWYEEDCEFYIPSYYHFDEMVPSRKTGYTRDFEQDEWRKTVEEGLINWYPEIYEEETGIDLLPGQSRTKDERLWAEQTKNLWRVFGVKAAGENREVTVRKGDERKTILMSAKDYEELKEAPKASIQPKWETLVPNIEQYKDITPPPPVVEAKPVYKGYDDSTVSIAKRDMVDKELGKRWRYPNGDVITMHELLEDKGIESKRVSINNGKREYYLSDDGYSFPVSKALWDIAPAPDTRTESTKIWEQLSTINFDSAGYDFDKLRKMRERKVKLTKQHEEALKREKEAEGAKQ